MSKNGMAGGLSNRNFRVDLSHMPDPKTTYVVNFPNLDGGLNIYDLDYRLDANESPDMQNLHWRDGALGCRSGQSWVENHEYTTPYSCYEGDFWGVTFMHIGSLLFCVDPSSGDAHYVALATSVPQNAGTFFRYRDYLMYKNNGGYYRISYNSSGTTLATKFTADALGSANWTAYVPKTYINMDPATAAGDKYQFENRLSDDKEVWYTPSTTDRVYTAAASGTAYQVGYSSSTQEKLYSFGLVYVDTTLQYEGTDYTEDLTTGTITFTTAPASGSTVTINFSTSDYKYKIPGLSSTDRSYTGTGDGTTTEFLLGYNSASGDDRLASVGEVTVDGAVKTITTDYTVNLTTGKVTFITAPDADKAIVISFVTSEDFHRVTIQSVTVDGKAKTATTDWNYSNGYVIFVSGPSPTNPITANTVKIVYRLANADAKAAIMECDKAIVYGGDQNLCVVVAGCTAQPNAYFWNGNHSAMDPSYFPMEQYNLAGDTEEKITGFGKQQGYLIIFKEHGIGRTTLGTETITMSGSDAERVVLSLDYTAINAVVGCDLPRSIQLVRNNLVFANRESGVFLLADSSAAHENNVVDISKKVNGSDKRHGLLYDIYIAGNSKVQSTVFNDNYWIVANEHAYLWDYELSDYTDPSWFYYTNIKSQMLTRSDDTLYHFDAQGRMTKFTDSYNDYGDSIPKVYQFATQFMSTYAKLKNVTEVLLVTRSDTPSTTKIKYLTDYEDRYDLTDIETKIWSLIPRNLAYRYLGVPRFAFVVKRKPMCRHVRHFAVRLENNTAGDDLTVISAQVFYNYQGGQK